WDQSCSLFSFLWNQAPISAFSPRPWARQDRGLPAGLAQAGNVTAHRRLAQHVAAQAKLPIHTTRTTGHLTAVALAHRAGVARQLLQLDRCVELFLVGCGLAGKDLLELLALVRVLLHQLRALDLAHHHGCLGHTAYPC